MYSSFSTGSWMKDSSFTEANSLFFQNMMTTPLVVKNNTFAFLSASFIFTHSSNASILGI
jgi:hypothetical protein